MGVWTDMARGFARVVGESLQKAAGPPPGLKGQGDGPPGEKGPPGKDGGGEGGFGGPPPPPPPPPRDMPEPTVGSGPTLAAPPPMAQRSGPLSLEQLEAAARAPKALRWDPFAIVDAIGFKDRPSAITYNTLTEMVWRCPIVAAIIQTRINQIFSFSRVQENKFLPGFRVQLRDGKARATPGSQRESQRMERWLLTTGVTNHPQNRDSFGTYLKKIVRDALTYDQVCTEVVPTRGGKPAQFDAIDARTIRIADSTKLILPEDDMDVSRWVQVYDGLVVNEWPAGEFAFGVRNPTADIRMQGYGVSELEWLIGTVTAMLFGWDYNQKIFTNGTQARGIINFKGVVPEKQIEAFQLNWYTMTAGIENAWKTPIVNSGDELQYIDLQNTNRDMEFSAWFDFLIKIACGIYGMDPMEVNFKYGDSGAGKQMFESANQGKLSASKDRGLKPLLIFLEDYLTTNLIEPLDEDFVLRFVGLDAQTPVEQADLNTKRVQSTMTVNEIRAEDDLEPLPNGMGDVILSPVFMDHLKVAQQAQQQLDASQHAAEQGQLGPAGDAGGQKLDQGDDLPEVPEPQFGAKPKKNDMAPPSDTATDDPTTDTEKSLRKAARARRRSPVVRIDIDV